MSQKTRVSKAEEEYFIREDQEKRHRLHAQHEASDHQKLKEEQKRLHFNKCPRCGGDLVHGTYKLIEAEHCPVCDTLTMSKADIEKLSVAGRTLLDAFLEVFSTEKK